MNRIQIAYPRGRREYIDVYGDFETMTVQDVLTKINNRSGDKAPFEKYFTFRNHHRFLDSGKCKQFLELYDNKNDAIESENPLPRTMSIRDIPGINPRNTKEYIWFNLDRNRCLRYITDLQMAQKRRSLAVASMLPQNVQENIMSQLDVDTVGEIGSRMRPSGRITQKLGLGKVPVELDDYDMDQNYDEFVEQRRRREQLRKQREELQRERDEDFEQSGGGLEEDCCNKYERCKKISEDMDRMDEQESMENNVMADYIDGINQSGGGSKRDLEKDCCNKYERCKKMSKSQQRAIDRITRLYEEKLFEDMDRMDEQESMENNAMADYIGGINQSGGMFNDLAIELIDEQLEKLNCRDRLSYCQTNRKSRDHCNSKQTFKKYIEPCRKKSKMNKTKRRAIEVSKRLQKKNQLESQLQYKQREIQLREERQEREFLERLRQPRDISIRRNTEEDFEFDDDDDELNGFPTHY